MEPNILGNEAKILLCQRGDMSVEITHTELQEASEPHKTGGWQVCQGTPALEDRPS